MNQVEGEFLGKSSAVFSGVAPGRVGGDTDLAGRTHEGVALERDYIRLARVIEKLSVHRGQRWIGQENEREFPLRHRTKG